MGGCPPTPRWVLWGRAVTIARKKGVRSAIRTAIELVSPPLVTCREVWSQVSIPVYGRIPGIGDVFVTLNGMGDRFRVRYTPHAESVLLDAEFTPITAGMEAVHRLIDYNRWNNPIAAEHLMQNAAAAATELPPRVALGRPTTEGHLPGHHTPGLRGAVGRGNHHVSP